MSDDVPRRLYPDLYQQITRHGKKVWYHRCGKGKRTRIRGEYGSPEFMTAYRAAVNGVEIEPTKSASTGVNTISWLISRYRDSEAWTSLSLATRRQRENIFKQIIEKSGDSPFAAITRKHIMAGVDRRAKDTPSMALNFLKAVRGLFQWATNAEFFQNDPTRGVKVKYKSGDGFHAWTEEEVERFEARWPLGTRERLAFDLLLYTGLRRGDAVRLGRQHVRDGVAILQTEKTGEKVYLSILPPLARSIEAGPCGDLAFIAGEKGQPMAKESFGNWFKAACKSAGVPGSAHGLRKIGAIRAAENGATHAQLNAMFGWRGHNMASLYIKTAGRARLARDAAHKMLPKEQSEKQSPLTSLSGEGNAVKTQSKTNT